MSAPVAAPTAPHRRPLLQAIPLCAGSSAFYLLTVMCVLWGPSLALAATVAAIIAAFKFGMVAAYPWLVWPVVIVAGGAVAWVIAMAVAEVVAIEWSMALYPDWTPRGQERVARLAAAKTDREARQAARQAAEAARPPVQYVTQGSGSFTVTAWEDPEPKREAQRLAAMSPAGRLLDQYRYIASAKNIFGPTIYAHPYLAKPFRKNVARDIEAVRWALWLAALVERHKRGYAIQDNTGTIIPLSEDAEHGWLVDEIPHDDGSASRIYCGDFTLGLSWTRVYDPRALVRGPWDTIRNSPDSELVEKLGIFRRADCWLGRYYRRVDFHASGWTGRATQKRKRMRSVWRDGANESLPDVLHNGVVPLLAVALHEIRTAAPKRDPFAPLSDEKGGAQFHWPE